MKKPNFGKPFFEKHQTKLVDFLNSRIGRWFFKLDKVCIAKDFRIYEVRVNSVSGDWKYNKALEIDTVTGDAKGIIQYAIVSV